MGSEVTPNYPLNVKSNFAGHTEITIKIQAVKLSKKCSKSEWHIFDTLRNSHALVVNLGFCIWKRSAQNQFLTSPNEVAKLKLGDANLSLLTCCSQWY